MNKSQLVIIIVLFLIILTGVTYSFLWEKIKETPLIESNEREVKDGEVKQYSSDGTLKTVVNYDNGVKQGFSYLLHNDGETILLAMPYEQGKRQGTSRKYYESGKVYAETNYQDDLLHGPRKVFYSSGKLKSVVNYFKGFPGLGTEEYLTSGSIKDNPKINLLRKGDIIVLSVDNCKDVDFFVGRLINDQYFDYLSDQIKRLPKNDGQYFLNLNTYTPSYLKYQDIICSCESSQGNPVILKKRLEL